MSAERMTVYNIHDGRYNLTGRVLNGPQDSKVYEQIIEGHPKVPDGTLHYVGTDSDGKILTSGNETVEEAKQRLEVVYSTGKPNWQDVVLSHKGKQVVLKGTPMLEYRQQELDDAIRDVVLELNSRGIQTLGSCAGHGERGFITLPHDTDSDSIEVVKDELRSIGANSIRFEGKKKNANYVSVNFDPLYGGATRR